MIIHPETGVLHIYCTVSVADSTVGGRGNVVTDHMTD